MNWKFFVLAFVVFFVAGVAFGAGGGGGGFGNSYMSDRIDLGDIWMGYNTETYPSYKNGGSTWTSMSASLGGEHKINSTGISISPYYWYDYDEAGHYVGKTQHGYSVSAYFSGLISSTLTDADVGNRHQNNSFNARGLRIDEHSSVQVYKSYHDWSNPSAGYDLLSSSYSGLSALNFNVSDASGSYYEWTPDYDPGVQEPTYFSYNVIWHGDFSPGTLSSGFVAPMLATEVAPVPEPSTWVLVAAAGGGLLMLRRRLIGC
jgi:hypothetical protein